jgi:hypothetical protein
MSDLSAICNSRRFQEQGLQANFPQPSCLVHEGPLPGFGRGENLPFLPNIAIIAGILHWNRKKAF